MLPSIFFSVVNRNFLFHSTKYNWSISAYFVSRGSESKKFKFAMSQEVIQRLETNATKAENLIADIYSKISEIQKSASQQPANELESRQLLQENELLRQEIAKYKELLLIKEIRNGANPVIKEPPKTTKSDNNTGSPPSVEATTCKTDSAVVDSKKAAPKITPPPESQTQKDMEQFSDGKSNKKAEKQSNKKQAPSTDTGAAEVVDVGRLDFRVGKIVEVSRHPDADSLYLEKIDCGEENPRTVVSGLVKFLPIEQMQDRMVVILCNLKPAKMRGVTSEAMVMCASTPEKVEVLIPPAGSVPGDLVDVEGFARNPDAVLNPKKKIFETVAPDLKTNEKKEATYKGVPWTVKGKGVVVTESLPNVNIK